MALPARLRHSISKREAETWLHVQNSSYPPHNYHNYIPPKDPRMNYMIWVCLKMSCTPKPNGFADHYPVFKWLFHWEY